MKAYWSSDIQQYAINLSEKELGVLIFGLTVAKYETKDLAVADLQKEFLDLNNAPSVNWHLVGECIVLPCPIHIVKEN